MPQIGPLEILAVCVVALIVFGPERLPEIGRKIGKGIGELKRMAGAVKSEFEMDLQDDSASKPNSTQANADVTRPEATSTSAATKPTESATAR